MLTEIRTRIAQQLYNARAGSAADYRIVYKNNALILNYLGNGVELYAHLILT